MQAASWVRLTFKINLQLTFKSFPKLKTQGFDLGRNSTAPLVLNCTCFHCTSVQSFSSQHAEETVHTPREVTL